MKIYILLKLTITLLFLISITFTYSMKNNMNNYQNNDDQNQVHLKSTNPLDDDINKSDDVISALVKKFKNKEKCMKNPYTFKMMFYYRKHDIQYDNNNLMNRLTYKNIVLTNNELITFQSINPYSSDPDEFFESSSFVYNFLYTQIHIPCLNRSLLCTHTQLVKEFQVMYPEIDFSIPKIVSEHFIDYSKATNNCLVLTIDPVLNMNQAAWICHDDLSVLSKFQEEVSEKIRKVTNNYDFFIHYIQNFNTKVPGVIELQLDRLIFIRRDKKILLDIPYTNIKPYSISLYSKENLPWSGEATEKPEEARCLKFDRNDRGQPEYFCVYYGRADIGMRKMLGLLEARWAAEAYSNKLNNRLQKALLNNSLSNIAKLKTPSMDLDDSLLVPIKNQIRNEYFLGRHEIIMLVKTKKLPREKFENEITSLKKRIVNKVCNSILVCIKAIDYCLEKGLLPLSGKNERIAMDEQNPYNSLMPKSFLKIPFPNAGILGKELMEKILRLKPGKTYITPIPEALAGEIPNSTNLKRAINTMIHLRDKTKIFKNIEELGQNCRTNIRQGANNLRRKVALLFWMGDSDPFFKTLSNIRNNQLFNNK